MRRCAFLTMSDPSGYVIDDDLARAPLAALGWEVETAPWDRPGTRWEDYAVVVVRSPWDYAARPGEFLATLSEIEARGVRIENPLPLIRWNLDKGYLRDLARRGVATVPTIWRPWLAAGELAGLFAEVGGGEMVLKPVVSASAAGAFRLDRRGVETRAAEVEGYFAERALMAQPFASAVLDEGEWSLFYFNGEPSHAVVKRPAAGDFRVQEEHGGLIRAVEPEPALRRAGAAVVAAVGEAPLYLRADLVRANGGEGFWLMELELTEPSLYLRMDPEAPGRFARALAARMKETAAEDHC